MVGVSVTWLDFEWEVSSMVQQWAKKVYSCFVRIPQLWAGALVDGMMELTLKPLSGFGWQKALV
jgi:hypothetical protein